MLTPVAGTTFRPGLIGDALAERHVAVEEHRARLDDGADPVALDPVRVGDGGHPLGVLVVEVRELEAHGLVGRAEVLVDEREPELLDVDGAVDALELLSTLFIRASLEAGGVEATQSQGGHRMRLHANARPVRTAGG